MKKKVTFCPSLKDVPDKNPKDTKPCKKNLDWLSGYMTLSLGLSTAHALRVLDDVSFEGVARFIKDNKCKNIITMAGAGISTSTGIPDYRSKDTGVYNKGNQDLFTIEYFKKDPVPYFTMMRDVFLKHVKPTPCHYFISLLQKKGLLLRHYTQNIDGLEKLSGLPQDAVIEAHGCIQVAYCSECGMDYTLDQIRDDIRDKTVPICREQNCNGVVRPDIVFFGEDLSPWFATMVDEDFPQCDLLIIMGTSLKVRPFATLTNKVFVDVPRLYINMEPPDKAYGHMLTSLMFGNTFDFDSEDRYRDVFKHDTCDAGCQQLADLIGWGEELRELIEQGHRSME